MNELLAVPFVEEPAEVTYEPWNTLAGGWDVDDLVSYATLHHTSLLLLKRPASSGCCIVLAVIKR